MDLIHGATGNNFLDGLKVADFDGLRPFLTLVDLQQRAEVCGPGMNLDAVWMPTTAVLSVIAILREGEGVEACTVGYESAYGLLNALGDPVVLDEVVVQLPGAAIRAPAGRFRDAAAQSPSLGEAMIRHAQANVALSQQSVACNAAHSVAQRLCRWLLMTQDRCASRRIPLTQELLGLMLGVQRTTVTAAAQELQAAGLIRYSRGQIEVLARDGLEARSCECYAALRGKQARLLGPARPRTAPGLGLSAGASASHWPRTA